jgi:hypothetical protein
MSIATTTYYVVQPFEVTKAGRIVALNALQAQSEPQARRMAEAEARRKGGAVAFSRTGDLSSGDFEDAVILGKFGMVPDDLAMTG